MPKISRNEERRPLTVIDDMTGEEVRVSSVLYGLAMLIAIVVAMAAWMGGSMAQIENRFAGFMDDTARIVGVSVNDVSVLGLEQDPTLAADIRAAAMIEPGENMFRADPHLIRRRVEGTRKVLNVRVHRLWPDQVVIIADAAKPVAIWHDGQEWQVVDGLGRILPDEHVDDYTHLIRLAGRGGSKAAPDLVAALADVPDVSPRVAIATRVNERRWDLRLVSGAVIRLPEDINLRRALDDLATLQVRTALMERPVSTIDLRNEGRIYLAPSDEPGMPSAALNGEAVRG